MSCDKSFFKTMVTLTRKQDVVMKCCIDGHNTFIHGPGGTGKSVLIRELYAKLKKIGKPVAITTPTGAAAVNLGIFATTIHSILGTGTPKKEDFPSFLNALLKNKKALEYLAGLSVLVVDEISFVSGRFLIILHLLFCVAKQCFDKPFGGLQLILLGDFFQLPPVVITKEDRWGYFMCFRVFKKIGFYPVRFDLTEVLRQEDPLFIKALGSWRLGVNPFEFRGLLKACEKRKDPNPRIPPVTICLSNAEAKRVNDIQLNEEPDEGDTKQVLCRSYSFVAMNKTVVLPKSAKRKYSKSISVIVEAPDSVRRAHLQSKKNILRVGHMDEEMYIRAGEYIMFRADLCSKVKNRTRGCIVGFVSSSVVLQGTNVSTISAEGFKKHRLNLDEEDCEIAPDHFHDSLNKITAVRPLPVVKLTDGTLVVVGFYNFELSLPTLGHFVCYVRMPFVPAWAITFNCAQGLTLDKVSFTVRDKTLPPGYLYVLVSRLRSLRGLFINGSTDKLRFWADKEVRACFGVLTHVYSGKEWEGPDMHHTIAKLSYEKWFALAMKTKLSDEKLHTKRKLHQLNTF